MKKSNVKIIVIALCCIAFCFSDNVFAQNAKVNQDGNYSAITTKTKEPAKETGKTFIDAKGVVYPVYESAKGKLFYIRTSGKTGNQYKCYISTDSK